jgi:DNA-binding NarL/FixJ family response regulator
MATKLREASARKTRIFIVDDHPIVREGLSLMMNREPDMMVCGEAEEASRALQAIAGARPDFVIVDISLSGPDGLDLLKSIRVRFPNLPVLILSTIANELHLSVKTVESYQAHIKEKLALKNGRELVQRAIQWNISENVA